METNTVLIANKESWTDDAKRAKIENIGMMLNAALQADMKVGLKLNLERTKLSEVLLTSFFKKPTISSLADEDWIAVETVIEKKVARDYSRLKRLVLRERRISPEQNCSLE